jgi:hypothetical protein
MIRSLGPSDLAAYRAAGDPLMPFLGDPRAMGCTAEGWLLESEAKRMIAWVAYEHLLVGRGRKILDVGAGFSSLSYALAERHDYTIAELCVHDEPPEGLHVIRGDWWDLPGGDYDLVMAVDIFPNADQRLAEFVARYEGRLRMILTTYPDRWYRVQRLDAEEQLTIRAWDWYQTERVLGQYANPLPSVFPNGRQIALVTA